MTEANIDEPIDMSRPDRLKALQDDLMKVYRVQEVIDDLHAAMEGDATTATIGDIESWLIAEHQRLSAAAVALAEEVIWPNPR